MRPQAASDMQARMSLFAILLAGAVTPSERLRRQLTGARVIAADSGMAHAAALAVEPELWVGDFDSASPAVKERYCHVPQMTFPAEKAAADGDLAIDEALRRGATRFMLCGALGGQLDHVLVHLGVALRLARAGYPVLMTSGSEEAWPLLPGDHRFDYPAGSRFSILPMADLTGLDLEGVKWPLVRRDVPLGSSLTLANVATGPVRVRLQGGYGTVAGYPGTEAP